MINWTKDSWEDVKMVLDELDYDYVCDFEGNLILHFQDFDIVEETKKEVVDHVDHMWLKFDFSRTESDKYKIQFYRTDIYGTKKAYTHPHVSESGSHCTGDYVRGVSLCRDLLYYAKYVTRFNEPSGWTSVPETGKLSIDTDSLNKQLIPTFYMDMTQGCPVLKEVEFEGDLNTVVKQNELKNPNTFFWKNNQYTQYSKGSRIEHIDLKKYFNYAQYFKRYSDSTRTISNANSLSEIQ